LARGLAQGARELRRVEGASHNDLYDRERYVAPAVAKLAELAVA
jgi:hypothetical protein